MRVVLAHISGFCDGVKRAMGVALAASARHGGLQSAGPLVHNQAAVELLRLHGIAQKPGDHPDKPMLVRAHGVPPDQRRRWRDARLTLVDATCAHVARNQRLAADAAARGDLVLLAGDVDHAEVAAVAAGAGDACRVVASTEDIAAVDLPPGRGVLLLAQTTFNADLFAAMGQALLARRPDAVVRDTICRATHDRQREARRLAGECEAVVVVGGRDSANTRRLAEAVEAAGTPAFPVETADDLDPAAFAAFAVVGVTSGASTPGWLTQEVVDRLRPWGRLGPAGRAALVLAHATQARVLTGLAAAGLALAAQWAVLGTLRPALALAGGGYVFFAHTLNRRTPIFDQARRWAAAERFYHRRRPALLGAAWAAAGLALAGAASAGPWILCLFAAAVAATVGYARLSRTTPDGGRVRAAAASLRNGVMAVAWAALLAGPAALALPSSPVGWAAMAWVFCLCLGGTLVTDLHDAASDLLMGICTLAGQLGLRTARRAAAAALGLAALLPLAMGAPLLALPPLWGLWLLAGLRARPVRDAVWLQAGVDAMGVAAGLVALGGRLWA